MKSEIVIGTAMAGGFYAGAININGEAFGLIVAPKQAGESEGKWCPDYNRIDAKSFCDGLANTQVMAEHDSPIAKWAQQLDIDGHQDWYVPSRDELEIIYRNLKPTSQENYCSFRDGENSNSIPPGHLYEEESPTQTTATMFQDEGPEAMSPRLYWSSTQCSAYGAFVQYFGDGSQSFNARGSAYRVRAVRRFKITN